MSLSSHSVRTVEKPVFALLGDLPELKRDPLAFFMRLKEEQGPIAEFRVIARKILMLTEPEHIEYVLKDHNTNFGKQTRGFQMLRLALGRGLLTSEGELWKRQRRIAQPAFHRDRIAHFADVMVEEASRHGAKFHPGAHVDAAREMTELTLRIVARTLFSSDFAGELETIGEAVTVINEDLSSRAINPLDWPLFIPTPGNRKLQRALRGMDELIYREVSRRRGREHEFPDLLSMLMEARDETGQPMSDEQLRDEFVTMAVAGHETTANALAWTWYLLSRHPHVARRLRDELAATLGGRAPTFADLPALKYTRAVVQESMRLYPPAWSIARHAIHDDRIGGVPVRAGTILILPQYVVHRDPRWWPNPEGFDPERFLQEDPNRPRFAYFPFGGGPHQCIGMSFAMMEAQLILATLAKKWKLELESGFQPVPEPLITLRPRDGLRCRLEPA